MKTKLIGIVVVLLLALRLAHNDPMQPPTPIMHAVIVEAYFGPGTADTGYFQLSGDLKHWKTFYRFPYPTANGATMRATNWVDVNTGHTIQCYFRAGYSFTE